MPPKRGPLWRGERAKGGAQDARQFAVCTWTCIQRTPQPARVLGGQDARRARHRGCVSLVTFFAQAKKVTRSPAGRVEALHFTNKSKELDSGLRRNDELKVTRSPVGRVEASHLSEQ